MYFFASLTFMTDPKLMYKIFTFPQKAAIRIFFAGGI